jgi:DNA-binding IclR family transcriptional regulator
MTASLRTSTSETAMSAMDAIFHRRAVRDYAPQRIEQTVIRILLDAAVHAPTAMDEEAWAFAVNCCGMPIRSRGETATLNFATSVWWASGWNP